MKHDVFISYRHEDQPWAERVCNFLESQNISCWVAFRDIPAGGDWPEEIVDSLHHCRFFVFLLSSASVNEQQISREVRIASDELKLPMFPVRIENVLPPRKIDYFLGGVQWLDAFDGKFDTAMTQLLERLRNTQTATTPPIAPPAAPRPLAAPVTSTASKNILWVSLAAAVIVIALIAYFVTRSGQSAAPPTPTAIPEAASKLAAQFLTDMNAGNYPAAWDELAPSHRSKLNEARWIKTHKDDLQANGAYTSTPKGCQVGPKGEGYVCDFTLTYASSKSGAATITVVQQPDTTWGVINSNWTQPQ